MIWIFLIFSPILLITATIFILIFIKIIRGQRMKKRTGGRLRRGRRSFFRRLFWDFPRVFVDDLFVRDPDGFPDYGLHLICGEQGSGKTITLAYLLNKYRKEYPLCKIRTNFYYKHQHGEINHWKDLVFQDNGIYGQLEVLDEVQNWFNSLQSKDFPVEMIQEITQQRKQRKIIFGTAQVFNRVAKPIREQVNYLYSPITIFGCLTIVRVSKPLVDGDGVVLKQRPYKIFFFVHDREVRESYDTYKKIAKIANEGFSPRDFNSRYK